jgi:methionyl-tRNA formyltransferase
MGIEALKESIELIKEGKAPRIPQDEALATYEGLCKQVTIDWDEPAQKIYNLIRGTNPQPGAATRLGDTLFKIFDAELRTGDTKGSPGEVIEISESGFTVAARGGAILVKRVQPKGSPKIAATEFTEQSGLASGSRLGA